MLIWLLLLILFAATVIFDARNKTFNLSYSPDGQYYVITSTFGVFIYQQDTDRLVTFAAGNPARWSVP